MKPWEPGREKNPAIREFGAPTIAHNDNRSREAMIEGMYIRLLSELAMNRFKWEGLPTSVNPRFLELTLYQHALSVFFFNRKYNRFMALRGGPAGYMNYEDDPVKYVVTGSQMETLTVWAKYCVPIWSNYFRTPDTDIVRIYAKKLANVDRTIEINSMNARQSRVLIADKNTRLSADNLNRMIDEGEQTLAVKRAMGEDLGQVVQVLDMGVNPDTIERMSIVKQRLWNEALTYLGIDNANQDKKERMNVAEVNANGDEINHFRSVSLNARQQAADEINRKYGLAVSVDFDSNISRQLEMIDDTIYGENDVPSTWTLGGNNGNIHA